MNELANFWDIIVKTNTFNFAILVLIFAIIFKKMNIGETIESIKHEIIRAMENAKAERENAKIELANAQKSIEHIDDEIKERLEDASSRAEAISKQILDNTENQVKLIESNIGRVITAEEKTISSKITSKTLLTAIELAKQHIKSKLENEPQLHDKYINESIDNIDKAGI